MFRRSTTGVEHIADFGIATRSIQSATILTGGWKNCGINHFLTMSFSADDERERVYCHAYLAMSGPRDAPAIYFASEQYSRYVRADYAIDTPHGTRVRRFSFDILGALSRAKQGIGTAVNEFYRNVTCAC